MASAYRLRWPAIAALLGALGLTVFYLGIVTLAESSSHALELLQEDALFGDRIGSGQHRYGGSSRAWTTKTCDVG